MSESATHCEARAVHIPAKSEMKNTHNQWTPVTRHVRYSTGYAANVRRTATYNLIPYGGYIKNSQCYL